LITNEHLVVIGRDTKQKNTVHFAWLTKKTLISLITKNFCFVFLAKINIYLIQ